MEKTPLWNRSGTRTRRAWLKIKKRNGSYNNYFPRPALIQRWMKELNWTEDQVIDQFYEERRLVVKQRKGIDIP